MACLVDVYCKRLGCRILLLVVQKQVEAEAHGYQDPWDNDVSQPKDAVLQR